ncbi:hypothetical protein B0H10DRAFT_1945049 [Mycena sp. CBHHK59/15]|nr:hypothetical protein B0H10DRAFT_1945049 [Mycena sp. CBHHK59/15]
MSQQHYYEYKRGREQKQYGGTLNSQMGKHTFIDELINNNHTMTSSSASQAFDETDMDLLCAHCTEVEIERDEQDQALAKVNEWEAATITASSLIQLATMVF